MLTPDDSENWRPWPQWPKVSTVSPASPRMDLCFRHVRPAKCVSTSSLLQWTAGPWLAPSLNFNHIFFGPTGELELFLLHLLVCPGDDGGRFHVPRPTGLEVYPKCVAA